MFDGILCVGMRFCIENLDRESQTYYTLMSQNANTNLDQDLHNSREAKYARSQQEVKSWIFQVLRTSPEEQSKLASFDLADILKDGHVLCQLGNLLGPGYPSSRYKSSRMPFIQMENIHFFLLTCKALGMEHDEIFQTIDLYEKQDPYQVVVTLMSFSRKANEINPLRFPVIGPKIAKVRPAVPRKPLGLRG